MFLKCSSILRRILWGRNNQTYQTIDSGYTSPCPMLNNVLLVFMLCLTYFIIYIKQFTIVLYIHAICTSLYLFCHLSSASVYRTSSRGSEKRSGLTHHRKCSAITAAHSLAMQPLLVLPQPFEVWHRYWISYQKCHTSSTSAVASFHHAHILGQLCPGDHRWAADLQR